MSPPQSHVCEAAGPVRPPGLPRPRMDTSTAGATEQPSGLPGSVLDDVLNDETVMEPRQALPEVPVAPVTIHEDTVAFVLPHPAVLSASGAASIIRVSLLSR